MTWLSHRALTNRVVDPRCGFPERTRRYRGPVDDEDRPDVAPSHEHTRRTLIEKRAELIAKVEQLGAHDPAEASNLNFGKRIGDGTTYAVERMTGAYQARTLYETVREIDSSLVRLDEGTYGVCVSCGQPIPSGRLEVVPWAALCVPCSAAGRRH
jgi:DnaK suppressor protein